MTIATQYYKIIRKENSLVSYWRLNEKSGTKVIDWAARYGINGIYNGVSANGPGLISADYLAGSKLFGNSSRNAEIPSVEQNQLVNDIAIECWVCPYTNLAHSNIIGKVNSSIAEPYSLRVSSGILEFGLGNGATQTTVKAINTLAIGHIYHVVASSFKGNMSIFINGVKESTTLLGTQTVIDNDKPIYIGESGTLTEVFPGLIGEMALYSGALSTRSIIEHFSLGRQIIYNKPFYSTYDQPSYS